MAVHPTAVVHPKAKLARHVVVGPCAVIGEHVLIGAGSRIGAHAVLEGHLEMGEACEVFPFAAIGTAPQHQRYKDEPTRVTIGRGNVFREFTTIHRGTPFASGVTTIGDHNYFMNYVHIAHDCVIGSHIIMANAANLGGHVRIGDYAVIGALVGLHQFVRVGAYAMVGGCSAVVQDVPPFMIASGNRVKLYGLNVVGLKRRGFSADRIAQLRAAYRLLFRSRLTFKEGLKRLKASGRTSKDVSLLLEFIEQSERGVCR